MLRHTRDLWHYRIQAMDGDIGRVHDLYFDDRQWTIRHLVVTTGHWLPRHRGLIPPMAVTKVDEAHKQLHVALTKAQVANSPDIDTDKPVSRQHHAELYWYYGFTGAAFPEEQFHGAGDLHLRRTREVIGYVVHGVDDRVGLVDDFLVEDTSWMIRYVVVDAGSWRPGERVLVPPARVAQIRWEGMVASVDLSRAAVRNAPQWNSGLPLDRDYETRLQDYYGRLTRWEDGPAEHRYSPATSRWQGR